MSRHPPLSAICPSSCPTCRTAITHPSAAAVPLNFDLITALQQGAGAVASLQLRVTEAQQQQAETRLAARCNECGELAVHYCEVCKDDFCEAHLLQLHARKKFESHKVVAIAEKAALLAAANKRAAKANANKCPTHPDQINYLYCTDCAEAVCVVCVHSRHAAHSKIEIAEAAEQQRKKLQAELARINGGQLKPAPEINSLQALDKLGKELKQIKEGVKSSSAEARAAIDSLQSGLKAAVDQRCDKLREQLLEQEQAATVSVDQLLTASDSVVAAGEQLRAAVAEASGSDDHGLLADAPRVAQLFVDVEAQLRALGQQAAEASGQSGCVSVLRLEVDKAALMSSLAQATGVNQQRTHIVGHEVAFAAVARLDSGILQPAHYVDLARFFGQVEVPAKLIYRASRDGFQLEDWKARCLGKGPTMTIVKGGGFVFGAYTHCKWPSESSAPGLDTVVADPTGRSFLFSLVNATGKAVRFSLRRQDRAIQLIGKEVRFGADINNANGDLQTSRNFDLMNCGIAADQPQGIFARAIDPNSSYQPDDAAVKCDNTFFGGQQQFAAAEVEVFEL